MFFHDLARNFASFEQHTYFAAMLIWRNYFFKNRFFPFLYASFYLYVLYDVAYQNNEFFRRLALNFFASYSITAMCGIVFLFFCYQKLMAICYHY